MNRIAQACLLVAIAGLLAYSSRVALLAQTSDNPHVGTWRISVSESTFSPAVVPPKSDTATIVAVGAGQ